ncbi:MAG: glycosyltransferase [Bacteroidota bacterium]
MKVVHVSTSSSGGAGIAALRLHKFLLKNNIDSHFLSKNKSSDAIANYHLLDDEYKGIPRVKTILKNQLEKTGLTVTGNSGYSRKYLQNKPPGFEYFSFPYSNVYIESCPVIQSADIVHLHWIAEDFINYPSFFTSLKNKKFIWTLHDMNPFTGGCHHADNCVNYQSQCRNCPQLPEQHCATLAFKMQQLKSSIYSRFDKNNFLIVTPSQWMLDKSKSSVCFNNFNHHKIANPVNNVHFSPTDRNEARKTLGLPLDKKILLYISHNISNERKGISNLLEAVKLSGIPDLLLCAVGHSTTPNPGIHQLGYINDDRKMATAYSAADIYILPSLAENFPNTIIESLLCGTPVIASNTGGIPEQITDDGILTEPGNIPAVANAIQTIFQNTKYSNQIAISSGALKKFNEAEAVNQYITLYRQLSRQ